MIPTKHEIQAADMAIDWIDSLPNRIRLMLIEGAYAHGLHVTKQQAGQAMMEIADILDDLFAKDRHALVEVAGEPLAPLSHKAQPSVAEILNARLQHEIEAFNRVPTNPLTYQDKGEAL